jgi:hypothetical protein
MNSVIRNHTAFLDALETHDRGTLLESCSTAALPNHYRFHRPNCARPGTLEAYRLVRLVHERYRESGQ